MGEVVFRKLQRGIESTRGTAVAATAMIPGSIKLPSDRVIQFPEDNLGLRVKSRRAVPHQIHVASLPISLIHPTFQEMAWLLSCGLKGSVTPVEQTTDQDDYLWDFTPSLTSVNEPKAATLECGNDTQAYELEYFMIKKYTFGGNIGADEPVKVDVEGFAKQITDTTFTASLDLIDGDAMSANMTRIYIDPAWASIGSTAKTDLLKKWQLDLISGVYAKFDAAGQKTMTGYGESYLSALLTMTLEGSSVADGLWDDYRDMTPMAIRVMVDGPQIKAGDNNSLIFDIYGRFKDSLPMDAEENGSDLHTAIFENQADGEATQHSIGVKLTTDINAL